MQRGRHSRVLALALFVVALSACRGDDVVPDVFVDNAHCARDLDAAPFGACDVTPSADANVDAALQ